MNLTRQDVLAHQQHAPWADLLQVEQDLLLSLAMVAIFDDEFLSQQVAMRGGTALHKVHLAPAVRYSEDIDLVLVGERFPDHVEKALHRVLDGILGRPVRAVWEEVKLAFRNFLLSSTIRRLTFAVPSTLEPGVSLKVKVEVNVSEKDSWRPMERIDHGVEVRGEVRSAEIVTYSLDEILGTKMRALFQRRQGRDLFDLYWAMAGMVEPRGAPADPVGVVDAFQFYMHGEGSKVTGGELKTELEARLYDPAFCSDTDILLRAGVDYDVREAGRLVQERLLARF